MLSLLVLACGKTSRDSVTEPTGSGGLGARAGSGDGRDGGAGAGSNLGGKGGRRGMGEAGTGASAELSHVGFEGAPIYTRVQRLTNRQWENAVTDILRFGRSHGLSATFELPVTGATEFDNNELVLFVGWEMFSRLRAGRRGRGRSCHGLRRGVGRALRR